MSSVRMDVLVRMCLILGGFGYPFCRVSQSVPLRVSAVGQFDLNVESWQVWHLADGALAGRGLAG